MAKLYVAFLWHHHQPYYMDPVAGHFALPWARLHAVKDYIGMANLLAEFPKLRQVINLVPSLVRQLLEYQSGQTDAAMILARTPADSLSQKQVAAVLNTFFAASWQNMVRPHPRYRQLLARCQFSRRPMEHIAREFSTEDIRDLQVWGNLAWFHPTVVEKDDDLRDLIDKGRAFTEDDKNFVLDRQLEVMARIVPLHRRLVDSGQLELTTSPFYHPLIPLLCDYTKARAAQPDIALPAPMFCVPEDARAQVERAVTHHEQTFGARPRGMWPPEGAVSDDAAAVFAGAGLDWIVTDEEILAQSLGVRFSRDKAGVVDQPEKLYRPYRVACNGRELGIFFRDHKLSDRIGFRYHRREPLDAAEDLIARLRQTSRKAPENSLVVIALDGENCWEHYPNQGVEFLRNVYRLLCETPELQTVRISDYADEFGPGQELPHVFPGSWIGHCFTSWMGHWEKNRGWEHLTRARDFYTARVAEGNIPPDRAAAALDEVHIAEGSDWFWWYGEDHSTPGNTGFDALFRSHVRRVYELLDARPPDELLKPIMDKTVHESWSAPRSLIDVKVDGRRTSFFEWLGAGTYQQARDVGTIRRSDLVPVMAMYFGFGADTFFLCLDAGEPDARHAPELTIELWLSGTEKPALLVRFGPDGAKAATLVEDPDPHVKAARGRVIEIGAPLRKLGLAPGRATRFFVRVLESDSAVQRMPASGSIPLEVPADPESAYPHAEDMV